MPRLARLCLALAAVLLAGCEQLGIDSPEKIAAARDAEGKAIGGACRHAARAIEDCYALNKKADKAAVFNGWREMNDYMRENKIEPVAPALNPQVAKGDQGEEDAPAEEPAKAGAKPPAADKAKAKASAHAS